MTDGGSSMRIWLTRVLMVVVVAVAAGCAGFGVWLVVQDLEETGDRFHGLGAVVGIGMWVCAVTAGVLAVLAFRLVEKRPKVARLLTSMLALSAAGLAYPLIVDTSWGRLVSPLPLLLAAAALLPDGADR